MGLGTVTAVSPVSLLIRSSTQALEARLREVERDNDFLQKLSRPSSENKTVENLYRLVQEKNAEFPVPWLRLLNVPRALYYLWVERKGIADGLGTGNVRTVFDSSDGIFGHRMLHAKHAVAGADVSVGTVASIMAENGWVPSDPDKVFADLIGRDFTSDTPGTRLVGVPRRTGCIWPRSSTCAPPWSSAGPCPLTCAHPS